VIAKVYLREPEHQERKKIKTINKMLYEILFEMFVSSNITGI